MQIITPTNFVKDNILNIKPYKQKNTVKENSRRIQTIKPKDNVKQFGNSIEITESKNTEKEFRKSIEIIEPKKSVNLLAPPDKVQKHSETSFHTFAELEFNFDSTEQKTPSVGPDSSIFTDSDELLNDFFASFHKKELCYLKIIFNKQKDDTVPPDPDPEPKTDRFISFLNKITTWDQKFENWNSDKLKFKNKTIDLTIPTICLLINLLIIMAIQLIFCHNGTYKIRVVKYNGHSLTFAVYIAIIMWYLLYGCYSIFNFKYIAIRSFLICLILAIIQTIVTMIL